MSLQHSCVWKEITLFSNHVVRWTDNEVLDTILATRITTTKWAEWTPVICMPCTLRSSGYEMENKHQYQLGPCSPLPLTPTSLSDWGRRSGQCSLMAPWLPYSQTTWPASHPQKLMALTTRGRQWTDFQKPAAATLPTKAHADCFVKWTFELPALLWLCTPLIYSFLSVQFRVVCLTCAHCLALRLDRNVRIDFCTWTQKV